MGDLQAIGDAITGGVIGRVVEPPAGEGDGHTHETRCLNCGDDLAGAYCSACGQHAHVHRTLSAFFHDFLHGVLHFEGKIWRTLPLLAWKPGDLTRRYIDGQRASFVSPIALFLFSVFLMFGVLSWTGGTSAHWGGDRDLANAEKRSAEKIVELRQKSAELGSKTAEATKFDKKIRDEQADLAVIQALRRQGVTEATFNRSNEQFTSNLPWIQQAYRKARENPDLLLYKVKSNSYKWSWAIIPLSVPFVWLLFRFSRRFRLYDHTVFVTYSVAFMTLLMTVGVVVSAIGIGAIAPALFFIPPIHMYRQLRGAYGCTRFGALWRTTVLGTIAVLVLTAFVLLMGALGIYD